jgi:osmotically-inducible protein OsmY
LNCTLYRRRRLSGPFDCLVKFKENAPMSPNDDPRRAAAQWHKMLCAKTPAAVACRKLHASGHPALRKVACRFDGGVLTLQGQAPSFYLKQLAQSLVASIDEVRLVDNQLEVDADITTAASTALTRA